MTEAEDKEATDPNEAAMSTEMNRKQSLREEEAVNVSFSETAKSNDWTYELFSSRRHRQNHLPVAL